MPFSRQESDGLWFDLVLNLLKPALQGGITGGYPGSILQYFRAHLCVHHNRQTIVPHTAINLPF
jgi:hypothetical protein